MRYDGLHDDCPVDTPHEHESVNAHLADMAEAHNEGLHDDGKREFCPECEASPTCTVCDGPHVSTECPALNTPEVI